MADVLRDVRFGVRLMRRSPVFAALALLTLAFAVGANATVFTLVSAVWLEPRPVADPDRVVVVTREPAIGAEDVMTDERLGALRGASVFEGVAGQVVETSPERPRMRLADLDRRTEFLAVTPDYFKVLGLQLRGRDFTLADDVRGAPAVAVISDHLWRTAFGARPDILGLRFQTKQEPVSIVGVTPSGFRGARLGELVDIWIPRALGARMTATAQRTGLVLRRSPPVVALARLRDGVTIQEATTAIGHLERGRYRLLPLASVVGLPGRVTTPLGEDRVLPLVAAMALLVLLAGCATLATLMLVHLEQRRRELGVRLAMGSTSARLVRTVLTEMAFIALAGVTLALVAAHWTLSASRTLRLSTGLGLDRLDLTLDWKVIILGLVLGLISIVVAVLIGLRSFGRSMSITALTSSGATASTSSLRLRRGLLGTHVAATVVVLVGAALLLRTVAFAVREGAGFDVEHTLFVSVEPARAEFYDPVTNPNYANNDTPKHAAYRKLIAEVSAVPNVTAVALGETPIRTSRFGGMLPSGLNVSTVRLDAGDGPIELAVGSNQGSAGYIDALGVALLAGQVASPESNDKLITRSLAERLWPSGDVLGRSLVRVDDPASPFDETTRYRIVGVVEDFVQGSMSNTTAGGLITTDLTVESFGIAGISLVARTRSDAALVVAQVEQIVERLFPWAERSRVATGRQLIETDLGRQRLGASFFSGFGLVSLILGFGGVFGLVAYLAESRTREFGVRLALGATPARLMRSVAAVGLAPVGAATIVGLIAAALLSRIIGALTPGIGSLDPVSYGLVAVVMLTGAIAAGLIAALRIRHASPVDALKIE